MNKLKLNRLLMLTLALLTMCVTQVWGVDYELVTTITDGEYVIGAVAGTAGKDTKIYAFNTTDNSSWGPATEITPSNGKISNPASSVVWTLTTSGTNGFTLKNGSNYYYIGTGTGSGSVRVKTTSTTLYYVAAASGTSAFEVSGVSTFTLSSGNQLGYNIGSGYRQYANRSHASTTTNGSISTQIRFYKKAAAAAPHTVTFDAGTNGTCSTSSLKETSAGAGVTLPSVTANTGFIFKGWATTSGAATANAGAAGANYKPSADCTLYAVYGSLYTVTLGDNSATLTQTTEGGNVTLPSRTGNATWTFAGWSETNNATETTTAPTIIKAGDYKPTANVTLYPVYTRTEGGGSTTITQDYETSVQPTGWTSNSISRTNGDGIAPHGGSYWGSIAANGTAYIQYNTALTGNVTVTAYVARTTSNTNKGEFKIQTKSGSSSWTDRGTAVDVKSTTVDEWQTLTWSGTLSTEQVRILYTGATTAVRAIDDVSIVIGTSTTYYISVLPASTYTASVADGLINGSIN